MNSATEEISQQVIVEMDKEIVWDKLLEARIIYEVLDANITYEEALSRLKEIINPTNFEDHTADDAEYECKRAGVKSLVEYAILERQKLKEKKRTQTKTKPSDIQTQVVLGSKMKALQKIIDKGKSFTNITITPNGISRRRLDKLNQHRLDRADRNKMVGILGRYHYGLQWEAIREGKDSSVSLEDAQWIWDAIDDILALISDEAEKKDWISPDELHKIIKELSVIQAEVKENLKTEMRKSERRKVGAELQLALSKETDKKGFDGFRLANFIVGFYSNLFKEGKDEKKDTHTTTNATNTGYVPTSNTPDS